MDNQFDFGVLGLGVMGAALARNIVNHDFYTALYSVSEEERTRFDSERGGYKVFDTLEKFINALSKPRKVFLMITAGKPVDSVIERLLSLLEKGDIIMDGGNSYYRDTTRRELKCREHGIEYMGIGVSGGELGALGGPSMMVGGSLKAWNEVKVVLESIAAKHGDGCCCAYIGPEGAGHYVKMVHNGIEYAILQLIAETYHIMRFVGGKSVSDISAIFESWNTGALNSYLMEISSHVLAKNDEDGESLIDKILDVAEQKGTGKWTILEAIERDVYVPSIYEAQAVRSFSGKKAERLRGAKQLSLHTLMSEELQDEDLKNALLISTILCYSQGFELITKASKEEGWEIATTKLASVWKSGCIIRSRLLEDIESAGDLGEKPLILSEKLSYISALEPSLRRVAKAAIGAGMPMSGYLAALEYYDYYRAEQMPVNFIQALRDCFGAHTYMRNDRDGHFHTKWE